MPERKMESYLHNDTIKNIVAAHLYAMCRINDDEEVLDLTIGSPDRDGVCPIRYTVIQTREVELIVHS
jgi:hypothetical protein